LTHIQTNLAGDLSLETLAGTVHLSTYHFHRVFKETIGESVKQYTQRLRLEQAAYQLKICQAPIMDIAFNAGYRSHETFSRAFSRQFGTTLRAYRQKEDIRQWFEQKDKALLNHYQTDIQLSKPYFQQIKPVQVAFIRYLGAYIEADVTAFDRLIVWAKERGIYTGCNLLMGVGHDDPNITPIDKVRFDACIEVPDPFTPEGEIGYQILPGGMVASTTYIGPYGPTMEQAYGMIWQQLMRQTRYRVVGIPALEIYRTTQINPDYALNHTDILLPVEAVH
jgi:AraC family transcriptional regulator